MTVFDSIKNKNIDELAEWFDKCCDSVSAPWWDFWNDKYCSKCESIKSEDLNEFGFNIDYAYCELNKHCKFFKEMKDIPNTKNMIKMWLESDIQKICPDCKHFVGCECFDGEICSQFKEK